MTAGAWQSCRGRPQARQTVALLPGGVQVVGNTAIVWRLWVSQTELEARSPRQRSPSYRLAGTGRRLEALGARLAPATTAGIAVPGVLGPIWSGREPRNGASEG